MATATLGAADFIPGVSKGFVLLISLLGPDLCSLSELAMRNKARIGVAGEENLLSLGPT